MPRTPCPTWPRPLAAFLFAVASPALAPAQEAPPTPAIAADAPTPPAPARPGDELDPLMYLGPPETASPRLSVYGFADTQYMQLLMNEHSVFQAIWGPSGSFALGHLNIYLDGQVSEGFRSLVEVRFSYLPLGNPSLSSGGLLTYQTAQGQDYSDFAMQTRWGSAVIERAYLEYAFADWLKVRAGQFITPYGLWVMDHGSPTLIPALKPFIIETQLIPEKQSGLVVTGNASILDLPVRYYLTLSNGRGPVDSYHDLDSNKALGGRIEVGGSRWQLGVSGYRGRATDRSWLMEADSTGTVSATSVVNYSYDELMLGCDARLELYGFVFAGELLYNEVAFTDSGRPAAGAINASLPLNVPAAPGTYSPDMLRMGGYVLVGYRTPWLNILPFYMVERLHANVDVMPDTRDVTLHSFGVNARVRPEVALKAQYSILVFGTRHDTWLRHENVSAFVGQVAWAF